MREKHPSGVHHLESGAFEHPAPVKHLIPGRANDRVVVVLGGEEARPTRPSNSVESSLPSTVSNGIQTRGQGPCRIQRKQLHGSHSAQDLRSHRAANTSTARIVGAIGNIH